jgi:hypothetical protein
MIVRPIARAVGAAAIAWLALTYSAQAQQQQPTPAAVALATQLLEIKGGLAAFDPAIDGVISHHKSILLQINPNLTKDIDAVDAMMRTEVTARRADLHREVATGFASVFSEQDLKDLIAFYKTPLGKKLAELEPRAGQESTRRAQEWVEKYAETTMGRMRAEMKKRGHTEF